METSSKRQKQKLTLTESHRLARSFFRQSPFFPRSPLKRVGLISVGVLAGLSIPVIAITSQQAPSTDSKTGVQSTDVHVNTATSPDNGEAFSTIEVNTEPAPESTPSSGATSTNTEDVQVTINGEPIPLVDGSVLQTITSNSNSSQVDIDVSVDSSSTSSSSNSTDISIDTHSSSTDNTNTRGSPRR